MYINNGFPTTITFSLESTGATYLKVKEIQPPGIDGGGEIDITTMLNSTWRTRWPKSLKTLSECVLQCLYDSEVYTSILSMINAIQQLTIHFPDTSTTEFWGYVNRFTPAALKEGEVGMAEVQIIPTNVNTSGVEEAPTYTPG